MTMTMTGRFFSLMLCAVLTCLPLCAGESDPARRAWMNGYDAMTQAEKAQENHAELAALHGYEKALDIFVKVQKQYPKWNTSLITYRIEYCQKKIAAIKEANQQNAEYLSKEELFAKLTQAANEAQALKERQTILVAEMEKNRQALERARAEAASQAVNEENLQILRKDRDTLAAQVRALSSQLTAAKEDLQKALSSKQGGSVEELSEQLKRAQAELATANRNLEQVVAIRDDLLERSQREAQWRKQAEEQLAELRRVAESARRQQEESEQELQKVQSVLKVQENGVIREDILEKMTPEQLKGALRNQAEQLHATQMDLLNAQRKQSQAEGAVTRLQQALEEERIRSGNNATAVKDEQEKATRTVEENKELKDQVARLQATVEAQKELLVKLEKAATEKEDEARRLFATSQSASGIAAEAQEMQTELEGSRKNVQEVTRQRDELTARLSRESTARQKMEEQLALLASGDMDAAASVWHERAVELQVELEDAQKRLQELESALVRRDMEKRNLSRELQEQAEEREDATAQTGVVPVPAPQNLTGLSVADQVIVRGFLRQGVEAERSGKTEAAQWNYSQALAMQPDNFLALKRMGLIASSEGKDGEAAKYLSAAMKCNADDTEVLLALGFSQLQLKQPAWALASLSRAAALLPQDARTARLFGVALSALEWREAAMVQLQRALKLDDTDAEAAFNLAMIGLTRSSELDLQARREPAVREALEHLAASLRKESLEWYRKAVANGAQEDKILEEALMK